MGESCNDWSEQTCWANALSPEKVDCHFVQKKKYKGCEDDYKKKPCVLSTAVSQCGPCGFKDTMTTINPVDSHTRTGRRWKSWPLCHSKLLATAQMPAPVSCTVRPECMNVYTVLTNENIHFPGSASQFPKACVKLMTLWFVSKLTGTEPSLNKLALQGIVAYL